MKVVGSSHNTEVELNNNDNVKFKFHNIQLPDSTSNLASSQGYVIFEISPKPDVLNGSIIKNRCHIYFDYNPAVVTNSVMNTAIDKIPECETSQSYSKPLSIEVYPNPTFQLVNIKSNSNISEVALYDLSGRHIFSQQQSTTDVQLDVSSVTQGIYLLEIRTSSGFRTKKLIIQ